MAMPVSLTARQRAHLKARAHPLEPVVSVGKVGVQDAVVAEVDAALTAHGLIKVRINGTDRDARKATAEAIGARTDAAIVQQVGKVVVLWRPRPEDAPAAD